MTCFKQAFANYLFQARFCALKISTINETKLVSGLAPIKYLEDLCDNLEMLFIVQSLHRKHQSKKSNGIAHLLYSCNNLRVPEVVRFRKLQNLKL